MSTVKNGRRLLWALISLSCGWNWSGACQKAFAFQFNARSGCRNNQLVTKHVATALVPRKTSLFQSTTSAIVGNNSSSDAAQWHIQRRKAMLDKYGDQIAPLERESSSQAVGLPLLLLSNLSLLIMSIGCGIFSLSIPKMVLLAIFPGSMFSLWQLQILHDCLHGSLFDRSSKKICGVPKKQFQDRVLFWGSMPSVFGYYLYLKYGHLTHHKNVGDPDKASLAKLFNSDQQDFEDGDVLFVAHRMNLKGDIGPTFSIPFNKEKKTIKMSLSKTGFNSWRYGNVIWNSVIFASSFLFERLMLVINDVFVSLTGKNAFFPNKPESFHRGCASYARAATALRLTLLAISGWKSLFFLYLCETLWSLPPHPASAMFITNHPSSSIDKNTMKNPSSTSSCIPSMSTYAGAWYSLFTLGTNYHCEHHDFPTIPLNKLSQLRKIAPEFYRSGSNDNIFKSMKSAFSKPDFYACMDATNLHDIQIQ